MSNGYNDWKNDMESGIVELTRDGESFQAVQYDVSLASVDSIEYALCDFICEDVEVKKVGDSEILVITVGIEYDNRDGTWTKNYQETLYVFPKDWVLINLKTGRISVVQNKYVRNWQKVQP